MSTVIKGSGNGQINLNDTTGSIQLNGSDVLTIDSSGNLTAPNNLTASGNLSVTGTVTQTGNATFNGTVGINGATNNRAQLEVKAGNSTIHQLFLEQNNTEHGWQLYADQSDGGLAFFRRDNSGQTERIRLLSAGNMCIGTTNAIGNAQLTVVRGGSSLRIAHFENTRNLNADECLRSKLGSNCNNTSSYHYIASIDGGGDKFMVLGNGNVINSNNSYGAMSDVKLKENIVDATPKLDDLMQVKVRNYNLIGDEKKQLGIIAQELEQIFPNMVDELPDRDEEGNQLNTTTKSVKYSVFVPMLIKAIQEQQEQIKALETRIQTLESANV